MAKTNNLENEKIKIEILKLKSQLFGEWVKNIKNILIVLGFLIASFSNWGIYFFRKQKQNLELSLERVMSPQLNLIDKIKVEENNVIDVFQNDFTFLFKNHIIFQIFIVFLLFPLVWNIIKKRKERRKKHASSNKRTN